VSCEIDLTRLKICAPPSPEGRAGKKSCEGMVKLYHSGISQNLADVNLGLMLLMLLGTEAGKCAMGDGGGKYV